MEPVDTPQRIAQATPPTKVTNLSLDAYHIPSQCRRHVKYRDWLPMCFSAANCSFVDTADQPEEPARSLLETHPRGWHCSSFPPNNRRERESWRRNQITTTVGEPSPRKETRQRHVQAPAYPAPLNVIDVALGFDIRIKETYMSPYRPAIPPLAPTTHPSAAP